MVNKGIVTTCLLAGTVATLPACRIVNGQIDYSWVGEQFTPPVEDSVIIDRGSGALDIPASEPLKQGSAVTVAPPPPIPQAKQQGFFSGLFGQNTHEAGSAKPTGYTTYTVVAGDTLSGIARRYGTRTNTLISINKLDTTRPLQINQKLQIPTAGTPAPEKKQTPATRSNAPSQQSKPGFFARLFGQNAASPQATTGLRYTTYTVVVGDTLSAIARRHGTTAKHLIDINRIDITKPLQVNQKLRVPSIGAAAPVPSAPTAPATPAPVATPAPQPPTPTLPVSEPIGQLPPVSTVLPTAAPQTPAPAVAPGATSYAIQPGDTLYGIARRLGISPATLMQLNGLTPETAGKLRAGTSLQVPETTSTPHQP